MANTLLSKAFELEYITKEQFEKAEKYKKETGVGDETAASEMKLLTEENILDIYGKIYPYKVEKDPDISDESIAKQFEYKQLSRYGFLPEKCGKDILIMTSRPAELLYAEDLIRDVTGYKGAFQYLIISGSAFERMTDRLFKKGSTEVDTSELIGIGDDFRYANIYDISESDSSVIVNLVNKIFREAVDANVSDIHFEPQEDGLYVRFREDGTLREKYVLPINISRQLINRIKTMSKLDVNNNKIIQDGNARLDTSGRVVDLRVSVVPSVNGENMVIRILDKNKSGFDVSMLGFSKENEDKFLKLIRRPQGIILLTGPTGSGKSTSLYAALSALNSTDKCIITFEDPVEYRIPGIVQVQINPAMDVTFPQALKGGLRQDIEVALVGEIRDEETAAIAFDAANTGHLVFSTLHTNSAASSILRLAKMGIDTYVISRTLVAVINQRLAKRICPHCKTEYMLEADSPYRKVLKCGDAPVKLYRGTGCRKCNNEGYKGRVAIQEFLVFNEEIGNLLDSGATTYEIEQAAIKNGMKKIHQDGIEKALSGITTMEEVHRTVFFDDM
ncbi:MAG: GspE/PulE family protein [Firmicutes bacterium]|nr:GspE/PulE family protein [Bacillota bacterium]